MSIAETDKIDIIGTVPDSKVVRLVITDHLDWDDNESHSRLLQDKINTYIGFVESDQLLRTRHPPIPPNPKVEIVLVAQQQPGPEGMVFLEQVKEFLARIGIGFSLEVHE
jgi:hypothetical protein